MEHLMNELVGRSIAQERERDIALRVRRRRGQPVEPAAPRRQPPPRHPRGSAPVVALA